MPELAGFDVQVVMDGRVLPQYHPQVHSAGAGPPVASCWIPSAVGKEFKLRITPPPAPRASQWSFVLKLDGKAPVVTNSVLLSGDRAAQIDIAEEVISPTARRPFHFASLALSDDDALLWAAPSAQLGEIALEVNRVAAYVLVADACGSFTEPSGTVHERALKKSTDHCVQFGEVRQVENAPRYWKAVDSALAATFVFKYRTMDVLVAQGIAPRAFNGVRTNAHASGSSSSEARARSETAAPSSSRYELLKRKAGDAPSAPQGKLLKFEEDDKEGVHDLTGEIEEVEAYLQRLKSRDAQRAGKGKLKAPKRRKLSASSSEVIDLTGL